MSLFSCFSCDTPVSCFSCDKPCIMFHAICLVSCFMRYALYHVLCDTLVSCFSCEKPVLRECLAMGHIQKALHLGELTKSNIHIPIIGYSTICFALTRGLQCLYPSNHLSSSAQSAHSKVACANTYTAYDGLFAHGDMALGCSFTHGDMALCILEPSEIYKASKITSASQSCLDSQLLYKPKPLPLYKAMDKLIIQQLDLTRVENSKITSLPNI